MDVWKTGIRAQKDGERIVRGAEIARCINYVTEEIEKNALKCKSLARESSGRGEEVYTETLRSLFLHCYEIYFILGPNAL